MAEPRAHQPFETWLLEDAPLSTEQANRLQEHLDTCRRCSQLRTSWNQIARQLSAAGMAQPAPGFIQRWQSRLAERRLAPSQRQSFIVLGLTLAGALVLAQFRGEGLLALLDQPASLAITIQRTIVDLLSNLRTLRDLLSILGWALGKVSPWWWLSVAVSALAVSGLWTVLTYRMAFRKASIGGL